MTFSTPYEELLNDIMATGQDRPDRTGTGTRGVFGTQMRFDLTKGFPLITSKKIHTKSLVHELLYFLSGETNQTTLLANNVNIWKKWGDEQGNLGPIYSHQWRNWGGKHKNRPQPPQGALVEQGSYVTGSERMGDQLLATWRGMIARCYNPDKDKFSYYGGRGVYVHDRWLNFDNFRHDAVLLDGWSEKLNDWQGYQLDKDLVGDGFCYSPYACSWVSLSENMQAKSSTQYLLRHDDGREESIVNRTAFRKAHGISQGNFDGMIRGERPKAGGWRLVSSHDPDKGIDQIAAVIEGIKADPFGRRHIVTAWNPADLPDQALPPCHVMFQFYVSTENTLSCHLYQRSADMFLGVPFNIASYALLTHMVAAQTGLTVGEFIWTGGDTHIYKNHFTQVRELLSRDVIPLPTLHLEDRPTIFDYRPNDIQWTGYHPHPTITASVAV